MSGSETLRRKGYLAHLDETQGCMIKRLYLTVKLCDEKLNELVTATADELHASTFY